jgi:hypothetical protein
MLGGSNIQWSSSEIVILAPSSLDVHYCLGSSE